ncbi:MAG TPA: hypothetical protein VJI69_00780 [Bacteroidia bacterium]|nr:hypothetical protein [Bacteroidia bacterium]
MKKVEIFLYSLYAIGIVLKLFKLPMHTVFILLTLLAILIYYVFCLIKKNKDIHSILVGFLTVLWLFCLLTIFKHFSFQNIVWIASISSSALVLFLLYKNKKMISRNSLFCSVIIAITIFFKFLPAHHTYYLTNIKFNHEIEIDYYSWDKYSWFLYIESRDDEAMQANQSAQVAVEKCLQNPIFGDENEYLALIKEHELAIKNKTWKKYR